MLKSSLWDYSDANILVNGTITAVGTGGDVATIVADKNDKQAILKNCALFIDFITEINNTQVDNAKDVVMPMYNLIEHSDNYSKISESLYQFCGDEPNNIITDSE